MARVSDLIRGSKLETSFHPDCSVEIVHTYQESDLTSRRRVVARSEHSNGFLKLEAGHMEAFGWRNVSEAVISAAYRL